MKRSMHDAESINTKITKSGTSDLVVDELAVASEIAELVELPSHSYDLNGLKHAKEWVKDKITGLPLKITELPSVFGEFSEALYVRSEDQDDDSEKILLVGHIDTVYTNISDWKIRIEGDRLYGPGAIDMKSGIVVMIEILRQLHARKKLRNISVLFTVDEEQGTAYERYPQFAAIAKEHDIALVFEPTGDAELKPDFSQKHIVVSRKGLLIGEMQLSAAGGHSGVLARAEDRHSAIHELIYQATQLLSLADFENGTTINVGKITGGEAFNVLAQNANMQFDCRMKTQEEYERMLANFQAAGEQKLDSQVDINTMVKMKNFPVPYSSQIQSLFKRAQEILEGAGGKFELIKEHRGGGSDANRLTYFNPELAVIDSLGPIGAGEHTTGEFLYIDSLPPTVEIAYTIISGLLKDK